MTKLRNYRLGPLTSVALLTMTLTTGCAVVNPKERIDAAARMKAGSGEVAGALAATRSLPEMPTDCRQWEASGVALGDRLDVALLKTDRALTRANLRVRRCHQWHLDLKGRQDGR